MVGFSAENKFLMKSIFMKIFLISDKNLSVDSLWTYLYGHSAGPASMAQLLEGIRDCPSGLAPSLLHGFGLGTVTTEL